MTGVCPECGAIHEDGDTCQEIFDEFLVLEFSDPEYGEVHFLTVACFMIQHGRYSDEGLVWIQKVLRRCLEENLTAEQVRRIAAEDTASSQRKWKVARARGAAPVPKVAWRMTIADVARGYQDAESYRQLVTAWARETLGQMTAIG